MVIGQTNDFECAHFSSIGGRVRKLQFNQLEMEDAQVETDAARQPALAKTARREAPRASTLRAQRSDISP